MQIEPKSLGIPLYPRQWFWLKGLIAVVVVAALSLFIAPDFGVVFAASTLVVAPVLLPYFLSKKVHDVLAQTGWPTRLLVFMAVVAYLRLAKTLLAPSITEWLSRVVS